LAVSCPQILNEILFERFNTDRKAKSVHRRNIYKREAYERNIFQIHNYVILHRRLRNLAKIASLNLPLIENKSSRDAASQTCNSRGFVDRLANLWCMPLTSVLIWNVRLKHMRVCPNVSRLAAWSENCK